MDPLTAGLASLRTADDHGDLHHHPLTNISSIMQHASANAANNTPKTSDGSVHASSEHGSSSTVNSDGAEDVLSPLGSPRAVSSPIPVPAANGLSSRGSSEGGSTHSHFNPDISYPKSGLGGSPHNPSPRARGPGSNPARINQAGNSSSHSSSEAGHHAAADGLWRNNSSMPPPSPPDPDLDPEVLGQLLQKHASPALTDTRFSMDDFLKNKARLATAARRELGGGQSAADDDDVGSCLEGEGYLVPRDTCHAAAVSGYTFASHTAAV